jgi:hypothetical protein
MVGEEDPSSKPVLAVHEKDLDGFLKEIGLFEALTGQGIRCEMGDHTVTRNNLGYIFFVDRKPRVCCDKPECYYALAKKKGWSP